MLMPDKASSLLSTVSARAKNMETYVRGEADLALRARQSGLSMTDYRTAIDPFAL